MTGLSMLFKAFSKADVVHQVFRVQYIVLWRRIVFTYSILVALAGHLYYKLSLFNGQHTVMDASSPIGSPWDYIYKK